MEDFIDPKKIIENLDLKPDMLAADFGCGSGGSAIPLAKKLYEGLVYAFDVQEGPLNALKGRSIAEKINNIKTVRADLEKLNSTKLADSYVDVVVIINVIFQSDDKEGIINEAKRILKQGGQLMIVDWKPGAGFNAIAEGRVSIEDLKKTAEKVGGLKLKKEFEAGKFHYGLILIKI
jgi:ubiquinone/menaquinone biosynthesis C-methylase UbiE